MFFRQFQVGKIKNANVRSETGALYCSEQSKQQAKANFRQHFVSKMVLGCTAVFLGALLTSASASAQDRYRLEITNNASKLKADVMWASTNSYQGVFLWPDNNSASQEFDLLDSGNGYFRIRARHSGQCLMIDWRQGSYNGTNVIQYPHCDSGYSPGEWRRGWVSEPVECYDGPEEQVCRSTSAQYPVLINRFSGKCLDARNGSTQAPGAQAVLQQWDCISTSGDWNSKNQIWGIAAPGQKELYW